MYIKYSHPYLKENSKSQNNFSQKAPQKSLYHLGLILVFRSLSSPAAAAAAAAAGLFPPGLEALYRQAGFPTAFLGLGGGAGAASVGSAAGSTTAGSTSASSTPHLTTSTNINSPYTNIGLQSHANNPSCK